MASTVVEWKMFSCMTNRQEQLDLDAPPNFATRALLCGFPENRIVVSSTNVLNINFKKVITVSWLHPRYWQHTLAFQHGFLPFNEEW
jgi:hypothetical protein